MATLSSTLAWKIPWTEEPGRLQSMVLQRVRYDWATSLSHREQPMHTTSFMERFSLSQVCIFSAGYCREICLMWTGVSWQKQCSHPLGFPGGWDDKESACSGGDLGLIPGLGRCPGEENGNPLQDPCLENSMGQGAWQATVHGGCKKSDTTEWLNFLSFFHPLKLECFTLKLTWENSLGVVSLFTAVSSWHNQLTFQTETLCLDLLTRSSSKEHLGS